ncbi:MAG: hypothetical protein L6Q74_18825 [Sphaerotilus natans subsp. sulfidivorans]|uniref:hypothetical protein n=1 Tax=Sphaerotilus sulfidivorans TaxID=639200 RepID=UPI0023536021|nr:hypothetical protein [Sphaerotilus sulfidivorans]MCK6403935.1 hypothetical protein [Sphaerotilus sulfidivorans]
MLGGIMVDASCLGFELRHRNAQHTGLVEQVVERRDLPLILFYCSDDFGTHPTALPTKPESNLTVPTPQQMVAVKSRYFLALRAANKTQSSPSLSESLKADERQGSQRCPVGEVGTVAA